MAFATALAAAGIGMQAGAAIQAGRAAEAQAKASKGMADYNAAVAEQNAKMVAEKTKFDQRRHIRYARRVMGKLRAKQAVGGARLDVGAAFLVASEQAYELELENLLIGYEGQIEAGRWRSQAAGFRLRGEYAEMRGEAAKRASLYKAGATLLTGFGTMRREGMLGGGTTSTTPSGGSVFSRTTTSGKAHRIGR